MRSRWIPPPQCWTLNESPSEKEGKSRLWMLRRWICGLRPSMKVPPKRKGNLAGFIAVCKGLYSPSMKVPPKRKGNG